MVSLATKHNDPEAKLGWGERIGYGTGQLGMNAINAVLGSFLTIYFTNAALLDAGIIATIIAVSKIFDGISDLIVGNMVDRTHSKYGKARVWLMRMCIPFAVTTVLLFFVPQSFPDAAKYVYVFIMYNLVNAVFYTAMLVPYYSMISLVTNNANERGMLGNIQQIFQTLANVVINSVFIVMLTAFTSSTETIYTQRAFMVTMIIISAAMVLLSFICVFSTRERVTDSEPEGGQKKEKKDAATNPVQAFKALVTNRYWIMMFFAMFVIFFNALKGLGLGMSGGMAMGMVADTITYSKLKSGIDPVGMGNAAISAAQKLGLGLGTAVLGWVMDGAGFDPSLDLAGIAQPDTVITAIRFLYNWVPVILCGIVFVCLLFFYDIEKKLPAMQQNK